MINKYRMFNLVKFLFESYFNSIICSQFNPQCNSVMIIIFNHNEKHICVKLNIVKEVRNVNIYMIILFRLAVALPNFTLKSPCHLCPAVSATWHAVLWRVCHCLSLHGPLRRVSKPSLVNPVSFLLPFLLLPFLFPSYIFWIIVAEFPGQIYPMSKIQSIDHSVQEISYFERRKYKF